MNVNLVMAFICYVYLFKLFYDIVECFFDFKDYIIKVAIFFKSVVLEVVIKIVNKRVLDIFMFGSFLNIYDSIFYFN